MASKRLQMSVSGRVLEYLEHVGRSAMVDREAWAGRGLRQILYDHLDQPDGAYAGWVEGREEEPAFID